MAETFRIHGQREVERAFQNVRKDTLRGMRPALRKIGDTTRARAQALFSSYDERSAAGYKVRVRMRGVAVEQSLRRTTGDHPQYGALQMTRALLPALKETQPEAVKALDELVSMSARKAGF